MRLVITGAAGVIGRELIDEFKASHNLVLIDKAPVSGAKAVAADLSRDTERDPRALWLRRRTAGWPQTFKDADAVVHLAADSSPQATWQSAIRNNIQATRNVIEAAAVGGARRFVFASSHWAVKALEETMAPACYCTDGPKIGSDAAAAPKTFYGLSKAIGELTGRMRVDDGGLAAFVAVRIGYYARAPLPDQKLRARWIGADDIRSLFRRCLEADIVGFHVVYGVSAQPSSPFDLSYTRQLLGWSPKQLFCE